MEKEMNVTQKQWAQWSESQRAQALALGISPPKSAISPLDKISALDGIGQSVCFPCRPERLLALYKEGLIAARKGGEGNASKARIGQAVFGGDCIVVEDGGSAAVKNVGISRLAALAAVYVQSDDVWDHFRTFLRAFQSTEDAE